jgi:outer membrane receptor protein involved in Fe transport
MLLKRASGYALLLALVAAAFPARAQEEPPFPDAGTLDPNLGPPPGIEAIEVSGERLDATDIQDEAQAITAFSGADLDRASIVNVDSLQFNVPGLHVGQSGTAPIITLRGIGTENASLTGEPGVAFHIDGINMARPAAARVAFFDLESLDVKRGPQGLLGGKNSTSGSINIITRKPSDEFEVAGDVLFGNYDHIRYRGALNVPLGEYAAARFAYFQEMRDGFLDDVDRGDSRDPFDADDWGGRFHLRVNPTESVELLFSGNFFEQGGVGPQADVVPRHREDFLCNRNFPVAVRRTLGGRTFWARESRDVLVDTDLTPTTKCATRNITNPIVVSGWVEPGLGAATGETTLRDPATGQILIDPLTNAPIPTQIRQVTNADGTRSTRYLSREEFIHVPASEDTDPRKIHLDTSASQLNRYWGWSTQADWDVPEMPLFGETHVKLLGGFQHTGGDFVQDFDATDAVIVSYDLEDKARQYTSELLWDGMFGERLEWQTSFFYAHEKASRDVAVPDLLRPTALPQPTRGVFIPQETNNKSYGAALNNIFNATDDLRLSLGGRWIKDSKQTKMERFEPFPLGDPASTFRGCEGNLASASLNPPRGAPYAYLIPAYPNDWCSSLTRGTMWGAGVDWRPFGGDHLLYAKLDRGYKSGGFQAGTVGTYTPERIWAYAAGTKSEFFDQRLTVNFEAFFYAYSDLQLVILDGFSLRTENSDARMYGYDIEADATPIDGLRLGAVVSFLKTETLDYFSLDPTTEPPGAGINENLYINYQNQRLLERESAEVAYRSGDRSPQAYYENRRCYANYTEASAPVQPCGTLVGTVGGLDDFSGKDLSRSPKWKITLSSEYEIPLGSFGSLTPRVQYTWQDDTYFRAFNRDFDLQEAHHLTNAKLIWTSPEDRWSVEAFIENIEDETPKQNILIGPRQINSPPLVWYGPPRFYGVQVGFKY